MPADTAKAKAEREATHRAEVDQACDVVHTFIQAEMKPGAEDARRAYQAFCILRSAARAERTFDLHMGERIVALEERVGDLEKFLVV